MMTNKVYLVARTPLPGLFVTGGAFFNSEIGAIICVGLLPNFKGDNLMGSAFPEIKC